MGSKWVLASALLLIACAPDGGLFVGTNSAFERLKTYEDPRGLDPDTNPDRTYIVGMSPFAKPSSRYEKAQKISTLSADPNLKIENLNDHIMEVEFNEGARVQESLDRMINSSEVAFIEPNYKVYAIGMPNDTQIAKQWAHAKVQSEQAWNLTTGSNDIIVAVIDTGTDITHPDLKDNIWTNPNETLNGRDDDGNGLVDDIHGWDFQNNDNDPADDVDHGTHVAGTIGAVCNNGMGICGQSQKLKMLPLKFLGQNGGDVSHAIKAIEYAISKKVKVMSNSWGGGQGSQALVQAITKAEQAGIMFIAAAGNESRNADQQPSYPAAYTNNNIISVAATDSNDGLANFSNYGARSVDLGAPGVAIWSTQPGNRYQEMQGTSMATPLVSGVVALMYAMKPTASVCEIRKALLSSVDAVNSLQGKVASNGRINAFKAVDAIKSVACSGNEPAPNPQPSPTGTAKQVTLNGQIELASSDPNAAVTIAYDVDEFVSNGAVGVYIELSQPNQEFSNPNGTTPDPNRLNYAMLNNTKGTLSFVPSRTVPSWGTYALRVIPLNSQNYAVGKFSSSSHLKLAK
jgi:hypothetical protein